MKINSPDGLYDLKERDIYRAFQSKETLGTVLHAIALAMYPEDLYDIDPVELYYRFQNDIGTMLTIEGESRLQAIMTAVATDVFSHDVVAFGGICKALTRGDPGLTEMGMEDPTLVDVMWGMYEVFLNREEALDIGPKVQSYVDNIEASESDEAPVKYFQYAVIDMSNTLKRQLKSLGFTNIQLPAHPVLSRI